jgi:ParB-like chromosome segregation protein Spo0J
MTPVPDLGRTAVRSLQELRIHPALEEIGFCAVLPELQEVLRCQDTVMPEQPLLVTQNGVILAGFGRWRMAVSRQIPSIECLEYTLTDDDALQFMLSLQKRGNRWNAFIRIRLALRLEETLQQRALTNMQMGGRYKGSATLPKAAQIDVREQIATIAGTGGRNVSKVKEILHKGHPRILGELANGSISINRAHLFCRLPRSTQTEALADEYCDRVASDAEGKLLEQGIDNRHFETTAVLTSLLQQEERQPGSVSIRLSRRKRSVLLVGEDLQALMPQNAI